MKTKYQILRTVVVSNDFSLRIIYSDCDVCRVRVLNLIV